jgi:hypothetical protein
MNRAHKIISKLPVLIVWYWLFCAIFLVDTDFYKQNFKLLDVIDSVIVILTGLHFLFFRKNYTVCAKVYFQCVYVIIILNFCYFYLNEYLYYFFYYSIILTYIFVALWKTKSTLKS